MRWKDEQVDKKEEEVQKYVDFELGRDGDYRMLSGWNTVYGPGWHKEDEPIHVESRFVFDDDEEEQSQ